MKSLGPISSQTKPHLASLAFCWVLLVGATVASARPRPIPRPLYCEFIKKLGTDFLNDTTALPLAWNRHDGAIHYDRLGAFQAFALTNEVRFWRNVTSERSALRIRPLHLPGDSSPVGKVYYGERSGDPRFYYKPPGQQRARRPVLLSFEYRCTRPTVVYRRYFLLDVLPTRAPVAANWTEIPPVEDVDRFPDLTSDCPDIERLGVDYLADDREGPEARDTRSGTFFRSREAAFRVYGLGADADHDVDLTRQDGRLRVTLWTPPGSRPAGGTIRFVGSGSNARIVYKPEHSTVNAGVITFTYRCGVHLHRRDFLLDFLGGGAASRQSSATSACDGAE